MVAKASVMSKWHPGEHGTTFGGNPVACAAAMVVIETLRSERLPERAAALGERVLERARGWQAKHPRLGDVRGRGFMIGLEFMEGNARRRSSPSGSSRPRWSATCSCSPAGSTRT